MEKQRNGSSLLLLLYYVLHPPLPNLRFCSALAAISRDGVVLSGVGRRRRCVGGGGGGGGGGNHGRVGRSDDGEAKRHHLLSLPGA